MPRPPRKTTGARPAKSLKPGGGGVLRTKVFISYSHRDKIFLERLLVHLKPLERAGQTEVWVDTRIKAGQKWREEIQEALNVAKVAVLLVSIDFMTSDFINKNELPPLLTAARKDGVLIVPVIVRPCEDRFSRTPSLNQFQTESIPERPLSEMKYGQREAFWDRLACRIEDFLSGSAP